MKKVFLCIMVMLGAAGAGPALGQFAPAPTAFNSSLTLDVRALGNAGNRSPAGLTQPGLADKVLSSSTRLEIRARNLSAQPEKAIFQWIFYSRGVTEGRPTPFDEGTREETVAPGAELVHQVQSKEVTQSMTVAPKGTSQGMRYPGTKDTEVIRQGARPSGWVVRIFSGGKLVRVKGSSAEYEKTPYTIPAATVPLPPIPDPFAKPTPPVEFRGLNE